MRIPLLDSFVNLISGLGTSKDKATYNAFVERVITPEELGAMHRSDWLARKIVDIVPNEMTRAWRDWQAAGPQIEAIEETERALGLRAKVGLALQKARLYGGAAIIMGIRGDRPELPLAIGSVGKGDLTYLHVLSRHELTTGEIDRDIGSATFGLPKSYSTTGGTGVTATLHPSRVMRFIGAANLDTMRQVDGWGDSILNAVYDAVQNATSSQQHLAALLPEAKSDVIFVPGLSELLATTEGTNRVTTRFTRAAMLKSMTNMLLLEGDGESGERWEQKQIDFSALPDLARLFLQVAAGAADIPVTRLLGESPAGLNATGKSDERNFYDHIAAKQENELRPTMSPLDEVLIRSALGSRPAEIYYEWAPLWQLTEREAADVAKIMAETTQIYANSGLIDSDALGEAVKNMLVEANTFPGLEAAIDSAGLAPDLGEGEPDPDADPAAAAARRQAIADATPRTLYVRRDVVNQAEIAAWAKAQGLTDIATDMHVTIVHSRTPVDWIAVGNATEWDAAKDGSMVIAPGGPRVVEPLGDMAAVLMFASSQLCWRHEEIVRYGASHDFADYQPHISLTATSADLTAIEPYRGRIVLGPEVFAEIKAETALA